MRRFLGVAVLLFSALPFRLKGALADTSRVPHAWLSTLENDPNFSYSHRVQSRELFEQILERIVNFFQSLISSVVDTDTGVIAFVIGMLVLVVAIVVMSRRSGGAPWRVGGARAVVAGGSKVEDLTEDDLDRRIGESEAAGDYRSAVRYHFLQLLRELQDSGYIEWRAERTNREYYRALLSTPLAQNFSDVLMVFERVWYGEQAIEAPDYASIAPRFAQLRVNARRRA